jgi:hypothetical protein
MVCLHESTRGRPLYWMAMSRSVPSCLMLRKPSESREICGNCSADARPFIRFPCSGHNCLIRAIFPDHALLAFSPALRPIGIVGGVVRSLDCASTHAFGDLATSSVVVPRVALSSLVFVLPLVAPTVSSARHAQALAAWRSIALSLVSHMSRVDRPLSIVLQWHCLFDYILATLLSSPLKMTRLID